MLSLENQTCNMAIKSSMKQKGPYPYQATCGENGCQLKAPSTYQKTGNSDWDYINPACDHNTSKHQCPINYTSISSSQNLPVDKCVFGHANVRVCQANYDVQPVINALDPLRSKLYSDSSKSQTLAYNDPEFNLNIQKLFRCCGGLTKDTDLQAECGGYWRPTEVTKACNTNCKQTILQYCTDLNHPERLLTKGSLCNNWATQNDVSGSNDSDPTKAQSTNLQYVAPYLKKVCQFDNKPDNDAYSNVTINDYNDSCACYRPKVFYDTFLKSVAKKLGPKAMPFAPRPNPTCIWNACKTSSLSPPLEGPALTNINPNVGGQCPPINIAACTTTVNNTNINTKNPKVNIVNNQSCNINFGGDSVKKALDKVPKTVPKTVPKPEHIPSPSPSPENELGKNGIDTIKKKGSKVWILIVIIFIVVLSLAAAALFMLKK